MTCVVAPYFLRMVRIKAIGSPRQVGYIYEQKVHEEIAALNQAQIPILSSGEESEITNGKARIVHAEVQDTSGQPVYTLIDGQKYLIRVIVEAAEDVPKASIGFDIRTQTGVTIYGYSTSVGGISCSLRAGEQREFTVFLRLQIERRNLLYQSRHRRGRCDKIYNAL
jgi:hypothetical protein